MKSLVAISVAMFALSSHAATSSPAPTTAASVNQIAENHVKLVLAMGQHDPDYVDAYYGPPEWKTNVTAEKKSLDTIATEAKQLREALTKIPDPGDEIGRLRHEYLARQLSALEARVRFVKGERLKFD